MTEKILIVDDRKLYWLQQIVETLSLVLIPIFLGWLLGSSAMQWVGFLFGIIAVLAWGNREIDNHTFETTKEAIEHLETKRGIK